MCGREHRLKRQNFVILLWQPLLTISIHKAHLIYRSAYILFGKDLAEEIKKKWQEYTEELYKKGLHDPDNQDGVVTYLEPDIVECEVKWALESITMNKASGGMEFQLSYLKS